MSWYGVDQAGNIKVRDPYVDSESTLTLPSTVGVASLQPSFQRFGIGDGWNNVYMTGKWTKPLVYTFGSLYQTGIAAPTATPTVVASGTPGITGEVIARFTRAQYIAGKKIAESNPSPASETVDFTDQQAVVSGLETSSDGRTTHINVYLSVAGSLSFFAGSVILGTASFTYDGTLTELQQQDTLPLKFDSDGNEVDDILARGRPPFSTVHLFWARRLWSIDPTRAGVVMSAIDEPEAVNEDDSSFLPTEDGEYVIGIGGLDEELVLFCEDDIYSVASFGTGFRMRKVSRNGAIRFVCPMSVQQIQGQLWFASDQGVCGYVGGGGNGFRNLMARSERLQWISEYNADPAGYEGGCSGNDVVYGDYVFIPAITPTNGWRGYYRPMTEDSEAEPWWFRGDKRARGVRGLGQLFLPDTHQGLLAYGECDGQIRRDDASNLDDDGDADAKITKIAHKHFYLGGPQGDAAHGAAITNFEWFGKQADIDTVVNLYCGDDNALEGSPTKTKTIEPMPDTGQELNPTSRTEDIEEAAGKGVTVEIVWTSAPSDSVEHRGFALDFEPTGSGGQG